VREFPEWDSLSLSFTPQLGNFRISEQAQRRPAKLFSLLSRVLQSCLHAFGYQGAFPLSYRADYLEHHLAMRKRGIDCFCARNEINSQFAKQLQSIQKLLKRSRKSVEFPHYNDLYLAAAAILNKLIESWATARRS
jgi:hypothetical protein